MAKKNDGGSISSNDFFKQILKNSQSTCIFLLDKNGTILNLNFGVHKSLGYKRKDLLGKNFSLLFTPEDKNLNLPDREIFEVIQRGSSTDNNYVVNKEGVYIWCHGESVRIKDQEGNIYILKIIYDINEQKLLEKFLKESNQRLKMINSDLDTFVYSASHDLKAPINNLESLIEMLYEETSEECREQDKTKEIMSLIKISIDKFKSTISELSNIGKADKNNNDIGIVIFYEIVEEVKFDLREEIKSTATIFIEDFSKAPYINFPKRHIRSILYNLISNAIKYRDPNKEPVINLNTYEKGGSVILEIKDNGLGIDVKDQSKIFSKYERVHTEIEGTGIGLNIVKQIVDNYKGRIEIQSQPGKGTMIRIIFNDLVLKLSDDF